jgi:hypothetical protein
VLIATSRYYDIVAVLPFLVPLLLLNLGLVVLGCWLIITPSTVFTITNN